VVAEILELVERIKTDGRHQGRGPDFGQGPGFCAAPAIWSWHDRRRHLQAALVWSRWLNGALRAFPETCGKLVWLRRSTHCPYGVRDAGLSLPRGGRQPKIQLGCLEIKVGLFPGGGVRPSA
jgi:hypothetical protein